MVHPQNPDIVYAGAAQGGVWKTTNGGANWTALTDGQASLASGSLALDPGNPDIVYAGTGEPHSSADSYYGAGVLKSTDGGANWQQLGATTFAGMGISNVVVKPGAPNVLFVAASDAVAGGKPTNGFPGVYRSTDSGVSWTLINRVCARDLSFCVSPSSLVMDPGNPDVMYAGFDQYGVAKTTDGGDSWDQKITGWFPNNFSRVEVTLGASNGNVLYVGVETELLNDQGVSVGYYGLMYKSTDGGENWVFVNPLYSTFETYCGQQCSYDNVVAVHPANSDIVLAGGQALYSNGVTGIDGTIFKTTDGGASWSTNDGTTVGTTIHPDLHAIAFAPSNPNTIWIGNDGGVYRSTDGGATWEEKNAGLATLQFQSIALHPTNPQVIFGGMQDNAKAKTTGGAWQGLDVGDGGFAAIDPFDPRYWYGTRFSSSGSFMQFQRNDNNGSAPADDWPQKSNGIDVNDRVLFYAPLATDPNIEGRVYWGTHRLYRSDNRGDSWAAISPDLAEPAGRRNAISNFAIARGNSDVILVGTSNGKVQITTNGGSSWTNVTKAPLPNRFVSDVAIGPASSQTLYVTYNGFDTNTPDTPGHVFKSSDGGATWQNVSAGLPDLPVLTIAVDRDAPNTAYVGTDLGVFRSTDGGGSWAPYSLGMPLVAVYDLALNPDTDMLAAGTHGRSIWKLDLRKPDPRTPTPTRVPGEEDKVFLPLSMSGAGGGAPSATPTRTQTGATATATQTTGARTSTPTRTATSVVPPDTATPTRTTAAQTATPTQTATATQPAGLPTVKNGNFELGNNGDWFEASSNQVPIIENEELPFAPHSGSWLAWLGGLDDETSDLGQTFTLPSGGPIFLRFFYQTESAESVCNTDFDWYQLRISTPGGQLSTDRFPLCASNNTTGWVRASSDLSALAGQQITIHFYAETDDNLTSSFYVDDVSFASTAGGQQAADMWGLSSQR